MMRLFDDRALTRVSVIKSREETVGVKHFEKPGGSVSVKKLMPGINFNLHQNRPIATPPAINEISVRSGAQSTSLQHENSCFTPKHHGLSPRGSTCSVQSLTHQRPTPIGDEIRQNAELDNQPAGYHRY